MKCICIGLVVSAVCVPFLTGASRAADDKQAKPQPASTPEEAFTRFADAFNSDKFADALTFVADPGDAAFAEVLGAAKAADVLKTALDKQFGKADKPDPFLSGVSDIRGTFKDDLQTTGTVHATTELAKDRVRLTVWTTREAPGAGKQAIQEAPIDAVHTADGWKLEIPPVVPGPATIYLVEKRKDKEGKVVQFYVRGDPVSGKPYEPRPYSQVADELRKSKELFNAVAAELTKAASNN